MIIIDATRVGDRITLGLDTDDEAQAHVQRLVAAGYTVQVTWVRVGARGQAV